MKRAIALGGGGARGAYEMGVWKALRERELDWQLVTGVSIGSLNGAMMVQGDYDRADHLWRTIQVEDVMRNGMNLTFDLDYYIDNREQILPFLKGYVESKGADITPFRRLLNAYADEERFFASDIDFGLVTIAVPSMQPREVRKADIKPGYLEQWLLASCSCFPAFPLCKIDGESFLDGGYYDNLPIDLAFRMGADEVIAVGLKAGMPQRKYINHPMVTYIEPSHSLGLMLDFDPERIRRSLRLGYWDAMKALGVWHGRRYAFRPVRGEGMRTLARAFVRHVLDRELGQTLSDARILDQFDSDTPASDRMFPEKGGRGDALDALIRAAEQVMERLEWDYFKPYELEDVLADIPAALADPHRSEGAERLWKLVRRIRREGIPDERIQSDRALLPAALLVDFLSEEGI